MAETRPGLLSGREPAKAAPTRPHRAGRWTRRVLWLVVCLAGLLGIAHAPIVRGWVLDALTARIGSRYGLIVTATGLDYNLPALTASVDEFAIATSADPSVPLIRIRGLTAEFKSSALGGRIELHALAADDVAVSVRTSGRSGPAQPFAMPLFDAGRVDIRRLSIDYVGEEGTARLAIRGASLQLTGHGPGRLEGPFTAEGVGFENAAIRIGTGRFAGTVVVDKDSVLLRPAAVVAGGDTWTFDGEVALTGPDAGYRLGVDGTVSLALLHAWFPALPPGTGAIQTQARLTGRLAEPRAELQVETAGLTWSGFALPATTAEAVISVDGIDVRRLVSAVEASRLTASGHVGFGRAAASHARLEWNRMTPRVVGDALRRSWPAAPRVSSDGSAQLTWLDVVPTPASLGGTVAARFSEPGDAGFAGTLRVTASPGRWSVRARPVLADHTRADIDAVVTLAEERFGASALSGTISLSSDDARRALASLDGIGAATPVLPPAIESLPLEVEAVLGGSVSDPRLEGVARSPGMRVRGVGTLTAGATFSSTLDELTVERLEARDSRGATLEASGRLSFGTGTTDGSMSIHSADLHTIADLLPEGWTAAGAISAEGTWSGTLSEPSAEVQVTGADVTVNRASIGPLDATIVLSDRTARVDASVPDLGARLSGSIALADPFPFGLSASFESADIAVLSQMAPAAKRDIDASGTVAATVSVSGAIRAPQNLSVALQLDRLDARLNGQPLTLVQPAELRLSPSEVFVGDLSLRSGEASLLVDGRIDRSEEGSLAVTLDSPAEDVLRWAAGTDSLQGFDIVGRTRVEARLTGSIGAVALGGQANVTLDHLRKGERTLAEGVRADIALHRDVIEAASITGTMLGGPVELNASIPTAWLTDYLPSSLTSTSARAGIARLQGRSTLPLGALLELGRTGLADEASGTVSVSVEASATRPELAAVEATATIDAAQTVLGEVPFSLARPALVSLRAGRVLVEHAELRARTAIFSLEGYTDLAGAKDTDLRLTATGPLAFLSAVLPGRSSGEFVADIGLSGPVGGRTVAGTVALEEAGLVIPAYRLALTDWSGRVDVTNEALTAFDVRGQVNGGIAELRGRLPFEPTSPDASTLRLTVRDAFLEIVKGFKSQIDADLGLGRYDTFLHVDGSVTVVTGAYREPITAMAALFSNAGPAAGTERRGALDRVTLDVKLLARSPIVVENSLGRVDLVPDLRLAGSLAEPALSGALNALEGGRLTLAGRRYRILDSQVNFSPRDGLLPSVNLSSETRVGEYTINLRVRGPVDALETTATSTPPQSDRDLRSLIVTGRTADESGSDDDTFAIEALSSEILGFAGQIVGLDSIQFGRADFDIGVSDVNPATRLTVMKSLNRWFRIILSENLDDNRLTWIIVADSGRGYELRFSQRDNREEVIEFRHDLEFGPGESARRAPGGSAADAVRSVVSSVVFSGTPGISARDLQGAVKTRAGKPFDVEQWQRDRERLEALFRDRGYATARVTPRRTATETPAGDRVDVEYRIDRGPRTILDVDGASLPDAVVRDLLQAWSEAVLTEFFTDDIVRIVRQHLAGRNFLWPTVDVAFDQPSDLTERAMVRITPGPQADSKRIVFEGNRAVPEPEIRARASQGSGLEHAWFDSARLEEAIESLYRERGYLGTSATALPVEADGGRATLRVGIEEGPRARIGDVRISGVHATRLAHVQAAAGLHPGSVFLPATNRDASLRIQRWYEDQGFRSIDVRSTRAIGEDGIVAIDVSITEGPQSIVTALRVEGLESTRPATVAGAVTLQPGAPASTAAASDTQSRLYGLGVFKSAEVRFEPVAPGASADDDQVPVDAVVSVSEAKRYQLRYGVQLSNAHGPLMEDIRSAFGVAADVRDRNFLGRGLTLGASGRYERDLQSARGLLFLPRARQQRLESNFYATWRNERTTQDELTLVDNRQDVTFEQRLHLRRGMEMTWGYSYYWRNFEISRPPITDPVNIGGTLAAVQASLVVDRRDNVFDATRGWFHSQNLQLGAKGLGSDTPYTRYLLRQYVYLPVGPLVFASGVRWGTLGRVGDTPPLTILDLFFDAGGSQTVRGYAQDSLAALSLFDVPVGGTDVLILNQEVRFPIFKWIKGAAFIDAGNTFGSFSDVSLSGLAIGAGFGVRIQTPLAPFRLDVGFPIGPLREGRFRWHFSVGQMF